VKEVNHLLVKSLLHLERRRVYTSLFWECEGEGGEGGKGHSRLQHKSFSGKRGGGGGGEGKEEKAPILLKPTR